MSFSGLYNISLKIKLTSSGICEKMLIYFKIVYTVVGTHCTFITTTKHLFYIFFIKVKKIIIKTCTRYIENNCLTLILLL